MVVENEEKEVGVKKEEKKEKEDEKDAAYRVVFVEDQEEIGCKLSLDEEPDVGAGSDVSNCTLLVHDG